MSKFISFLLAITLIAAAFSLCGCVKNDGDTGVQTGTETVEPAGAESVGERQDGERFETVIMIEGMEETVKYEHIKNEKIGVALDYDYESLSRTSGDERETFTSVYDDQANPSNYMYIAADTDDPETAAGMFGMTLTFDFDEVTTEKITLDKAGECTVLYARAAKAEDLASDAIETVYIIPAPDGCRIARVYGTVESAEGFGARFAEMLDTLEVIPCK